MAITKNKKLNEGRTSNQIANGSVSADFDVNVDYNGKKYYVTGTGTASVQVSAAVYSDPGDYWNPPEYEVNVDLDSIDVSEYAVDNISNILEVTPKGNVEIFDEEFDDLCDSDEFIEVVESSIGVNNLSFDDNAFDNLEFEEDYSDYDEPDYDYYDESLDENFKDYDPDDVDKDDTEDLESEIKEELHFMETLENDSDLDEKLTFGNRAFEVNPDLTLYEHDLLLIDEIADSYCTSSPVSGSWETETLSERNEIADSLGIPYTDANDIMVKYLGFDQSEIDSLPIDGEIEHQ